MGTLTTRTRATVAIAALALFATSVAPAMAQDADAAIDGTIVEVWTIEDAAPDHL